MPNVDRQTLFNEWLLPLITGLLLLAVSGLGWYARDTRDTMHTNTERIVAAETDVRNTKAGMVRIEGAVGALDTKFDTKFDALMKELRQDARRNP